MIKKKSKIFFNNNWGIIGVFNVIVNLESIWVKKNALLCLLIGLNRYKNRENNCARFA